MSEDTWCDLELDHPLTAAAVNFDKFARMSGTDEVVCNLILKLLDPSQPHFEMWQYLYRLFYLSGEEFPIWKSPPGGELTTSLAYLCWFDLREAAISLLRTNMDPLILDTPLELQYVESWSVYMSELIQHSDRTLLQIAASLGREEFVEILLVKGANANAMPPHLPSAALSMVMDSEIKVGACQRMAATLLAAGADPNPPYVRETPLQAAIYGRLSRKITFEGEKSDVTEVVVMLLNAGADVNAIGSDEAMIAFIRHRSREKPDDSLDELMRDRVNGFKYNSPLLILEKQLHFDRASWGLKPPELRIPRNG
ncbi:MAG: hypothetical protein M1813_006056 [Trichoglossum hirsutum]|nr:MAG: hypothetical protein M1813_006056 [Trichoglossum hirsutum]